MMAPLATRSMSVIILHLTVLWTLHPSSEGVLLFNVGLPRTGTISFHQAVAMLNFSSNHIAFNKSRHDLDHHMDKYVREFNKGSEGTLATFFKKYDSFSDTPTYAVIEGASARAPAVKTIATWRNKTSWISSMMNNAGAASSMLYESVQVDKSHKLKVDLERIYDAYMDELSKFNIPTLDLADSDTAKFKILLANLPHTMVTAVAKKCLGSGGMSWPHENVGKMGNVTFQTTSHSKLCYRIIPKMSMKTLRTLNRTCDFRFSVAAQDAAFEHPIDAA